MRSSLLGAPVNGLESEGDEEGSSSAARRRLSMGRGGSREVKICSWRRSASSVLPTR